MNLEKPLERLLKHHGLLELLDTLASICQRRGDQFARAGKPRLQPFEVYETSTIWHRRARVLRRAVGELRHDEPDSEPVRRER
jgi:hypothetical protein